eukprot:9459066-Lingulodinium_polyedra.AAC.1
MPGDCHGAWGWATGRPIRLLCRLALSLRSQWQPRSGTCSDWATVACSSPWALTSSWIAYGAQQ